MSYLRAGPSTAWARRPRWTRLLVLIGILAALAGWAAPAHASAISSAGQGAGAGTTLTLSRLWNQAANIGSWTPYAITVRNAGPGTFNGTAVLVPNSSSGTGGPVSPDSFPRYQAGVSVPAGNVRTLTAYAIEPSSGYHAELLDPQGRILATADPAQASASGPSVAVVSDLPQAEQRISALLRSQGQLDAAVSGIASSRALPSDVIRLSGLNALVLDQFDSGTLSADQQRALRDFVGLGGTLVEVGGASARRTLGPLPADLVPMPPAGVATAGLSSLAELGGLTSAATAQVITGNVSAWARVGLAAPDGTPLIAEGDYGAGEIVELTFDPLVAPFDGQVDLAATAWSQALTRGLGRTLGGSSQLARLAFGGGMSQNGASRGSGPGAAVGFPGYLYQVLNDAPIAPTPPFGALAGLLVLYVLVVSVLAYALLKALGRRGLLWLAVPTVAILCTSVAYVAGFGARGSDYHLVQVQVQRLAPGGVVETSAFDGVLSPRRGDVTVTAPSDSLVSTATPIFGGLPIDATGQSPQITIATAAQVTFPNVAVWDIRPVQTLTMTHLSAAEPVMPVETQLGLRSGHLVGIVVNHTSEAIRDLQLVSPSGSQAHLASLLAPGATAMIDVPLGQGAPGLPLGKAGFGPAGGPGPVPPRTGGQALVALAVSEVAIRPGEWALVGTVAPLQTLRVGGEQPARTGHAMMVEPARVLSADSLASDISAPALVSSYTSPGGGVTEVYELDVPHGLARRVALSAALAPGPQLTGAPSVEVYDWDHHTWRSLPPLRTTATPAPLTPGELRGDVVRTRVVEDVAGQTELDLSNSP
jgi:hypothetical protein